MLCMNADIAELFRLLKNLIRNGTITEVKDGRARVQLAPDLITTWLRWGTPRAGDARTAWTPSVGEQVTVYSEGGDLTQGVIALSINSDKYPAPSNNPAIHTTNYADGAITEYDQEKHTWTVKLPDGSAAIVIANNVTANADHVTSNAPETTCTGNLKVEKNLIVNGMASLNAGMAVKGGDGGATATINGTLNATGDVTASGISLRSHRHGGVQSGGDSTGAPQ